MHRIILISGEKNAGKTTFLKYFLDTIEKKNGLKPAGFIAEGIGRAGRKTGFELISIPHHEKKLLCTDAPHKGWIKMGRFFFDPEGLRFGEWLLDNMPDNSCPVIIDEFGPLELSGEGWKKAVDRLLIRQNLTLMITVRKEVLARTINYFKGSNLHVFDIGRNSNESLSPEVAKLLVG